VQIASYLRRVLSILAITVAFAACRPASEADASDVMLINGKEVSEATHPHVYSIGGCTATFVSDSTLITAGHCVRQGGSVSIGRRINARSTKVIHHPRYSGTGVYDVAIAIFPKGTSQHTAPVFSGTLNSGDDVFAVGYGCTNGGGSGGIKREGRNKIAWLRSGVIGLQRSTNGPGSGESVTLCPGDSGGPLFRNNAVVGIASYWDGGAGRLSGHADLSAQTNIDFMKSVVAQHGAEILGLGGPPTPEGGGSQPIGNTLFAKIGKEIPVSGGDSVWEISTAAPASATEMLICPGRSAATCKPGAVGSVRSSTRTAAGSQAVFSFAESLNPKTTPEFVLASVDAAGTVTATRVVRVAAR